MNGIVKTIIFIAITMLAYQLFGYLGLFIALIGWFLEG